MSGRERVLWYYTQNCNQDYLSVCRETAVDKYYWLFGLHTETPHIVHNEKHTCALWQKSPLSRGVVVRGIVELTHVGRNLGFQVCFYLQKNLTTDTCLFVGSVKCMRVDGWRWEGALWDFICTGPSFSCYTPAIVKTNWNNEQIKKFGKIFVTQGPFTDQLKAQ